MKYELRRVDPLRAANIGALVYGMVMGAFSLIALPFVLLAALLAPSEEFGLGGAGFAVILLVMYPVMGLVMGWIGGLIASAIYNIIVRWTGGLILEYDRVTGPPDAPVEQAISGG